VDSFRGFGGVGFGGWGSNEGSFEAKKSKKPLHSNASSFTSNPNPAKKKHKKYIFSGTIKSSRQINV
jgi:hypothetical protein